MLYPEDIEKKLSFDRIRQLLTENCLSQPGAERVAKMSFSTDPDRLSEWLEQTGQFKRLLESGEGFPSANYHDVRDALKKSRTAGSFLDPEEFLEISQSLQTIFQIVGFLEKRKDEYPQLHALCGLVKTNEQLIRHIDHAVDENANVRDKASSELARLRNAITSRRQQLRKSIDSIFRQALKEGYVPEGASVTVRDGRMVIPVLAEYKRRIKGFIHDESATGQTVYLEPEQVLENNNELRELEYAERREVIRVLTNLTDEVRTHLPELHQAYTMLGVMDFIRAKAKLAISLAAEMPLLVKNAEFNLVNARHPLLYLNLAKTGRNVVPMSLRLDDAQRLIIISGPNAGGKSVCLKTVGILQYMVQCGLLIPVDETSSTGVFEDIFIDIGDEQSIENDLSTYSSHLTHMKHFLSSSGGKTLLLIDEFGTGTDPALGGSIAEAILDRLVALHARGVITTHYGNIKQYAEQQDAVVNGAMKYDVEHLEPLYQLQVGKPGSSFSFEVARKIGLDSTVIDQARQLIGREEVNMEDLILKLEQQEQQIRERDKALAEREKKVEDLEARYQQMFDRLNAEQKEIITRAKREAADLLSQSNREIEKTIRHIKENKAEKKETRRVREKLESLKKEVTGDRKNVKHQKAPVRKIGSTDPRAGDRVRIVNKDVTGQILAVRGGEAEVQVGSLMMRVPLSELEKIKGGEGAGNSGRSVNRHGMDINRKLADFNSLLDVRGVRGEEVLGRVDKFLDDALLFGINEARILHGKGDGILRQLIRNHLRDAPYVAGMRDENVEQGGAGITVLQLK